MKATAGDDIEYTASLPAGTVSATLHISRNGVGATTVGTNTAGQTWTFPIAGQDSALIPPGISLAAVTAVDGSGKSTTQWQEPLTILADPSSGQTWAARMVGLLEVAIEDDAPDFVASHTIGGTSIARMTQEAKWEQLRKFRAMAAREGHQGGRIVRVEFVAP